jgi:hypothetical protein
MILVISIKQHSLGDSTVKSSDVLTENKVKNTQLTVDKSMHILN